MSQNSFGEYLFQLRRRKKLLQKQVALEAGLDPSYLAAVENGRRDPPRPQILEKLLLALDASPKDRANLLLLARITRLIRILAEEEGQVPGVEIAQRLLESASKLSFEELNAIDTLVTGLAQGRDGRSQEVAM